MKKKTLSVVLFLVVFVVTYLIICFAIPGMRIKLAAEPMEYFLKSISHMVFIKAVISFVIAFIAGAIALFAPEEINGNSNLKSRESNSQKDNY